MNDKLIMENMLLLLKEACDLYLNGTKEASNKIIFDLLKHGLDETLKIQKEVYQKMVDFGWYQKIYVNPQKIEELIQKLEN